MGRRQQVVIATLDDHPNAAEIAAIVGRVPHLRDHDLIRLAAGWRNSAHLVAARDRALSPDSPLILGVLASFDRIATIFADDIAGDEAWINVPAETTLVALKAVRDAIAAAYARPIPTRGEYHAMLAPWRGAFPHAVASPSGHDHSGDDHSGGDPSGHDHSRLDHPELRAFIGAVAGLSDRCHDAATGAVYDRLAEAARTRDITRTGSARETAWLAAIGSGRRRPWILLRATVAEALGRGCPSCRDTVTGDSATGDTELVAELCADAACAILVSDTVPASVTDVLDAQVRRLIPLPRLAED